MPDPPPNCPCCNNPWSSRAGMDDWFCGVCQEENNHENFAVQGDPSTNFFQYVNRQWQETHPIPEGYPSWNNFLELHVQSQERCKEILENIEAKNVGDEGKLQRLFRAALDEDAVELAGIKPLEPLLQHVEAIVQASPPDRPALLGSFVAKYGISFFWSMGPSPDALDANHTQCHLSQGGLGLPDRDYYLLDDHKDKHEAYQQHIATLLALVDRSEANVTNIWNLEVQIAEAHMTRTENRDPQATHNPMTVTELTEKCGSFYWALYLQEATCQDNLGTLNVRNVAALQKVCQLLEVIEAETLRDYLTWHVVHSCAPYLPKAFVDANFEFYEKTLAGTQALKPRWKRAMEMTESAMGEALGKLYCAKYFDEESKDRALAIVEQVRQALQDRLETVDWIRSDETRQQALEKMSHFRTKIGYPDVWKDYSSLVLEEDDALLTMVLKARAVEHAREAKEMNAPTNREKWFMTPQTINAYFHPNLNEIVFPAAILQPPFFDKTVDDAVNFGAMGASE